MIHLLGVPRRHLGTAPWEINFAYFLVSRTTFYALSDGIKNSKILKKAKIKGQSSKFRVFRTFSITTALYLVKSKNDVQNVFSGIECTPISEKSHLKNHDFFFNFSLPLLFILKRTGRSSAFIIYVHKVSAKRLLWRLLWRFSF